MINNLKNINLSSIQSGFSNVKTSVKNGAQSVKAGTQRGFESAKGGARSGIGNIGARSQAFGAAFTTNMSSFASAGKSLPNGLNGLPNAIKGNGSSWKAMGTVRNFLGQATQLGITGLKTLTGLGGALVGVFAGLGAGAKAFATYKKPAAKVSYTPMTDAINAQRAKQARTAQSEASTSGADTLTSHPVSAPDSPAAPMAQPEVKLNLQAGETGVKVNFTTQEQKAAA